MAWAGGYRAPKKARGYGYEFQKLRKQLLPSAYGTPCVRCGEPMLKGQELHLDHADWDRSRILGFSHRACNLPSRGTQSQSNPALQAKAQGVVRQVVVSGHRR
jgi:hypothetical protein